MVKKQKRDYKFLIKSNPLDNWINKQEIGDGSFGKVYLAEKIDGSIVAACKVCGIDSEMDMDDMAQEVHILLTCKSQYILHAYEAYYFDQKIHMLLELCPGGGLDDVIMDFEFGLPEPFIQSTMYQMFRALAYLHKRGIIHRDIKAGNMLLTDNGLIKLADFGVSGVNSQPGQKRNTFIGTPYWMAPEVIMTETNSDKPYDDKCDVWSMGITCIELGEAQPPYNDQHPMCVMFVILKNPPPTFKEPEKWSDTFNDFISRCLSYDPRNRSTAEQLISHDFLQITEEKSKADVKELYRVYRDVEEEEIEIDIDIGEDTSPPELGRSDEIIADSRNATDGKSYDVSVSSSHLNNYSQDTYDTRITTKSDNSINEAKELHVKKSQPSQNRQQLKTVKKTRRFNVDGQMRTETVVTVVDENRKGIHQKEIKYREACMNEMKRLRRQEATELEKRREFYNTKIDEMEKTHFAEKQKLVEKSKNEIENMENSQNKEFTKKEHTLYEEQKKFIKKLKSDQEKEIKQIKKTYKKVDSKFQELREKISAVTEAHKDEFMRYVSKQSAELTKIKQSLLAHKHQVARTLESELWCMESRHIIELNELQATKHKDLGTMMFWQIVRRFKKELNYLQERTEFKLDETIKRHVIETKDLPKTQKAEMKALLEMEKKNYRKQMKHGLTSSTTTEKEYLKNIFDEKYKEQKRISENLKSEQQLEIEKIKEQFANEKSEIIKLMEMKQKEVYNNALESQLTADLKIEVNVRLWLAELVSRKNELLQTQESEMKLNEITNMKVSTDWLL